MIIRFWFEHNWFWSLILQLLIPSKRSKLRIKPPKDLISNGQWSKLRQVDKALKYKVKKNMK